MSSDSPKLNLSVGDQELLAGWAFKTTMLLTACLDGGTEVAKAEFERFRKSGTPPVESVVRLACSTFPTLALATGKIQRRDGIDHTPPVMADEAAAGFVALLLVGPLVFWIVRAPVEYLTDDAFHPPFAPIWPAQLAGAWPSGMLLGRPELDALITNFNVRPDLGEEPFPRVADLAPSMSEPDPST